MLLLLLLLLLLLHCFEIAFNQLIATPLKEFNVVMYHVGDSFLFFFFFFGFKFANLSVTVVYDQNINLPYLLSSKLLLHILNVPLVVSCFWLIVFRPFCISKSQIPRKENENFLHCQLTSISKQTILWDCLQLSLNKNPSPAHLKASCS